MGFGSYFDRSGYDLSHLSPSEFVAPYFHESTFSTHLWNGLILDGHVCRVLRDSCIPGGILSSYFSGFHNSSSRAFAIETNPLSTDGERRRCGINLPIDEHSLLPPRV